MRATDIVWYLLGRKEAIQRVAASRTSLIVGLLLVVMAGIAREYDQTYIPHFGIRFLFPVISSFIAAAIIYFCLTFILLPGPRPASPGESGQPRSEFRCFLGLFWMTAPLAWVYAFPAEHLYSPRDAAWINVGLLAFVAIARVLVLSRALAVLMDISFLRVLSSVTCISAVIMGFGSVGASMSLVQIMGGLRYSPEETVINQSANGAFVLSVGGFMFFGLLCALLANLRKECRKKMPASTERDRVPTVFLLLASAVWIVVLIPQQQRLSLNHEAQELMREKNYAGMLSFLSKHKPDDFNKVRRLPPDPYRYGDLRELPEVVNALNGTEAPWVRVMMLGYLDIALQHHDTMKGVALLLSLENVSRLPDGEAWIKAHANRIEFRFKNEYFYEITPQLHSLAKKLNELGLKVAVPELKQ